MTPSQTELVEQVLNHPALNSHSRLSRRSRDDLMRRPVKSLVRDLKRLDAHRQLASAT